MWSLDTEENNINLKYNVKNRIFFIKDQQLFISRYEKKTLTSIRIFLNPKIQKLKTAENNVENLY